LLWALPLHALPSTVTIALGDQIAQLQRSPTLAVLLAYALMIAAASWWTYRRLHGATLESSTSGRWSDAIREIRCGPRSRASRSKCGVGRCDRGARSGFIELKVPRGPVIANPAPGHRAQRPPPAGKACCP